MLQILTEKHTTIKPKLHLQQPSRESNRGSSIKRHKKGRLSQLAKWRNIEIIADADDWPLENASISSFLAGILCCWFRVFDHRQQYVDSRLRTAAAHTHTHISANTNINYYSGSAVARQPTTLYQLLLNTTLSRINFSPQCLKYWQLIILT